MQEKKMTDEEIVKDLERYNDEQTIENALDLIHRLQSENKALHKLTSKTQIDLMFEQSKTIETQKAEIERLTEDYEERLCTAANVYQVALDEKAELQKQVDELKECNIEERDTHFKIICGYKNEIARLEQAVKDTAKEIIDDFYLWLMQEYDEKLDVFRIIILKDAVNPKIQEYRKRYGVEVE